MHENGRGLLELKQKFGQIQLPCVVDAALAAEKSVTE
jgi:hypothetical protein